MDLRRELPYRADYTQFDAEEEEADHCNACKADIENNSLRLGVEVHLWHRYGRGPQLKCLWHHFQCFFQSFRPKIDEIAHYAQLRYADQKRIRRAIKESMFEAMDRILEDESSDDNELTNGKPPKKKKTSDKRERNGLKGQSDLLYRNHEFVQTMGSPDLIQLMDFNKILVASKSSSNCERLSDAMTFGRLSKCPECRKGQLVFRICGYICTGYPIGTGKKTKWIRCEYQTTGRPERRPFRVPKGLAESYEFLSQYKYEQRDRIYIPALVTASQQTIHSDSTSDSDSDN